MVTLHVLVPEQFPRHPPKKYLPRGIARSLTFVFSGNAALQVEGQRIPGGLLVTVPSPPAVGETVKS
jgi:phage tail protein X